jgi:hypothetical protein
MVPFGYPRELIKGSIVFLTLINYLLICFACVQKKKLENLLKKNCVKARLFRTGFGAIES